MLRQIRDTAGRPGAAPYGAGKSLAWINNMQEGPINIARKRAMRGQ